MQYKNVTTPPIEKTNIIWLLFIMVTAVLMCIIFANQAFLQNDPAYNNIKTIGIVKGVSWKREIPIEQAVDTILEKWKYEIPTGVTPISCTMIQSGVDIKKGTHLEYVCKQVYVRSASRYSSGHYVEKCTYTMPDEYVPTYDNFCKYNAQVWKPVNIASSEGNDVNPYWPTVTLTENQRQGKPTARYVIRFETNRGLKTFETTSEKLFNQCKPGSSWMLTIDAKPDRQNDKVLEVLPSQQ